MGFYNKITTDWFSIGFPSNPSWGWNKAAPKTSLYAIGMAHTANVFMLNFVELVHWAPIIPAFLMAQSILNNSTNWTTYFDNDENRTLLFLLSPIVAFFGGLPGIMMHTYEGWQVAPFDSPLRQQYPPGTQEKYNSFQSRIPMMKDGVKTGITERCGGVWKSEGFPMKGLESFRNPPDFEEAGFGRPEVPPTLRGELEYTNVVVADKNNQWLRIVAYFFIFNMQYIGLQSFSYAVLGPNSFGGCMKFLSIAGFFIGYLGNQDYKATFNFKWKQTAGGSTFPLAWTTLIPFMLSASLNMYAFSDLGALVFPGRFTVINSLAPPLLIALGGAIEGLFAETIFDQKIHAFAVILFNMGFWLELNMIAKGGDMLLRNN